MSLTENDEEYELSKANSFYSNKTAPIKIFRELVHFVSTSDKYEFFTQEISLNCREKQNNVHFYISSSQGGDDWRENS